MQDYSTRLREFMEREGLSQAKLAKRARVSQPTVSRCLKQIPRRHSESVIRLLKSAGIPLGSTHTIVGKEIREIDTAFKRIWDGSTAHAMAVVKVINALEGLKAANKGRVRR